MNKTVFISLDTVAKLFFRYPDYVILWRLLMTQNVTWAITHITKYIYTLKWFQI